MDINLAVDLIKARLGLTGDARDDYITAITNGVIKELEDEKGLVLDSANPYHLMFVVDFSVWRYQNRDIPGAMPRHLQYRLHGLCIHTGGDAK